MQLAGKNYHPSNPRAAWQHGIAHLPGDRGNEGLIVAFSVLDNLVMARPPRRSGHFSTGRAPARCPRSSIKLIGIRTSGADAPCQLPVGREHAEGRAGQVPRGGSGRCSCSTIRRAAWTWVPARRSIGLIRQKASEGLAILLSSEDMPELIGMSDRLVVLRQGVIAREFPLARRRRRA